MATVENVVAAKNDMSESLNFEYRNQKLVAEIGNNELESSTRYIHEKSKTDRTTVTKSEENHRRRTIIIEKKNGSYGFTLQSYGIHYKKEQEVEIITYVDYIEYDGPAYKAGMREGDVILSINGTDVEKVNHKKLVAFIKNCDTRMRMVVLFEDCVRKVELHVRYIQLQNTLQNKMTELEQICLKERELLEGKWRTHSLPARKKASTSTIGSENKNNTSGRCGDMHYQQLYRPTLSTEDVMKLERRFSIIPPPNEFTLDYPYSNLNYRYILRPSTSNSNDEYFAAVEIPKNSPCGYRYILTCAESAQNFDYVPKSNTHTSSQPHNSKKSDITVKRKQMEKRKKSDQHCHGYSCNPCIGHFGKKSIEKNGDNNSLDAYDLASSCCDSHCVPNCQRSCRKKEHNHKHKHRDKENNYHQRPSSEANSSLNLDHHHHHHRYNKQNPSQKPHRLLSSYCYEAISNRPRYSDLKSGLSSHCSLHSCTSSEFVPIDSSASYTSLSADTLYWEAQNEHPVSTEQHELNCQTHSSCKNISKQQVQKEFQNEISRSHHKNESQTKPIKQDYQSHYVCKPKSWDNIAIKGSSSVYDAGYSYFNTTELKPAMKLKTVQHRHSIPRKDLYGRYSTFVDVENYAPPPSQFVEETTTTTITTRSTESLVTTYNVSSEPCSRCDYNICASSTDIIGKQLVGVQYRQQEVQHESHRNTTMNCKVICYSNLCKTRNDLATEIRKPVVTAAVSEVTRL